MKFLLLFFISTLFYQISKAQLPDNVTWAKTADITDENNRVIAKRAIIPGLRSEIFLESCSQKKDSTGLYISEYRFIRPGHLEAQNVTLILQFSKLFENVYWNTDGETTNVRTTIADNKSGTSFQASVLAIDAIISIKVISKKSVIATITGIAGQL